MSGFPLSYSELDCSSALENLQELHSSQLPSPCKVPPKPVTLAGLLGLLGVHCPHGSQMCAAGLTSGYCHFMYFVRVSAVCRGRASAASDTLMVTSLELPFRNKHTWDFPGSPVVEPRFPAGATGLILRQRIPNEKKILISINRSFYGITPKIINNI